MKSREQMLKEIDESGYELSPEDKGFVLGLCSAKNWSVGHIVPVIDAVRRGVSAQEWTTLTARQFYTIEHRATESYRERNFDEAFVMFQGLRQYAEPNSKSLARALRGMAACSHSQGYLLDAVDQYRVALEVDPSDLICRTSLAEMLCCIGKTSEGITLAREIVAKKNKADDKALLKKAQNLIDSNGGQLMLDFVRRRQSNTLDLRSRATGQAAADLARELLDVMSRTQL